MTERLDFSPVGARNSGSSNEETNNHSNSQTEEDKFDPAQKAAELRILAYDAFHGQPNVINWLKREIAELSKTVYFEAVLGLLSRPDSAKILPRAIFKINNIAEVHRVGFVPGANDSTAQAQCIEVFDIRHPYVDTPVPFPQISGAAAISPVPRSMMRF